MEKTQLCDNCEEEFTVHTQDEKAKADYCPFCGDILLVNEEEDLNDEEWED